MRPVLVAAAVCLAAFLAPAQAAEQVVTGTVAAQIGIAPDGSSGGTSGATITREQRGNVLYVTVVPAG